MNSGSHHAQDNADPIPPRTGVWAIQAEKTKYKSGSKEGQNVYPKENFCLYCDKCLLNVSRHYETIHQDESEVAELSKYEKNSSKRRALQIVLKNKGNLKRNVEVLTKGQGEIIVVRRPEETLPADRFIPCPNCFGFFQKYDISAHKCPTKTMNSNCDGGIKRRGELLLRELTCPFQGDISKVISPIKDSSLRDIIANDELIRKFIYYLVEKHDESHNDQTRYIRERAKGLGEFLMKIRGKEEELQTISLLDFLRNPANFDVGVEIALQSKGIEKPRKTGHSIRKCLVIMRGIGFRQKDEGLVTDATYFDQLMATEWSDRVSAKSLKRQLKFKMTKEPNLPTSEDVRSLTDGLEKDVRILTSNLESHVDSKSWKALAEAQLAQVVVFNKRRAGEASRIKVEEYEKGKDRVGKKVQEEFMRSLKEEDRKVAQNHVVMYSPGKRGRYVPTVFTLEMARRIDLLIETRNLAGICSSNPFIFAKSGKSTSMNVWAAMKKYTLKFNVQNCSSTALRKYLATSLQSLNVTDMEMDMITQHMSHDKNVHKEFYRMDNSTLELSMVSKLLHHSSKGDLHNFQGHDLLSLPYSLSDEDEDEDQNDEDERELREEDKEKKRKKKKVFVTEVEKEKILLFFKENVLKQKCPLKRDIEKYLQETNSETSWTNVKAVVANKISQSKKNVI
jgi:hypothetical protein